ncbi:MAG: aminoglycoside phosphotransferase family protein [Micromonosporaceae bacterium]|nr:aminoglycoside phosphotransferase family protein [Micromonosporaceae bacterium]
MSRARLAAIVATASQRLDADPTGAELVKFTNNAVFRLPQAGIVLRIAGSTTMRQRVPKVLCMAHWLAKHGIPAVRPHPGIQQPLLIDDQIVTIWQTVATTGPAATGADLGRLLRRLHAVDDAPPSLPAWDPLAPIRSRLADAEDLPPPDLTFLLTVCDDLEAALAGLRYVLPPGVIHGDATVANLIPSPDGPVLCDFDGSAFGPREWDLTPVAVGQVRFVGGSGNHRLFVQAYGHDVTGWSGFPVLRRLRELQLVASVVPVLRSNPSLRPQWRHRFDTLRTEDKAAQWKPYA